MKHKVEIRLTTKSAILLGLIVGYNIGKIIGRNERVIILTTRYEADKEKAK